MMLVHVLNESYGNAFDDNDNQSHGQETGATCQYMPSVYMIIQNQLIQNQLIQNQ